MKFSALTLAAVVVACGGATTATTDATETTTSTTSTSTTTTSTTTTTTTILATTTTTSGEDDCNEGMEEVYATFDAVLDSADADPVAFAQNSADGAISELFNTLGGTMGAACGAEHSPDAYSDVILFLSNERAEREFLTVSFIEGMLRSLCTGTPFELSLPAQGVCLLFDE